MTENIYSNQLFETHINNLNSVSKKTPPESSINILKQFKELIDRDNFIYYESYLVYRMLPTVLNRLNDNPLVNEFILELGLEMFSKLSIQSFPAVTNILFDQMSVTAKWKMKLGCLKLLNCYIKRLESLDRDLLSSSLTELVPVLSGLVHDTRTEVSELAIETLTLAMKGITNRDLEPFVPNLVSAIVNPDDIEETIQQLGGIVFVQTIEGSALSVIIPLMLRGFHHSKSIIKRMCSRIVSNMSKLVEEPLEAAPFLDELIPALFNAIDTIANPEAREVAIKTHETLLNIKEKATQALENNKFRNPKNIKSFIISNLSNYNNEFEPVLDYISEITGSLIKTNTIEEEEYKNELTPYLDIIQHQELCQTLYNEARKVIKFEEDLEEDSDADLDICDCEFTLAYGTKVLLHNTKMKLKKGKKYGLLGQNDCGKTTLMRAIADGSIDGFPDQDEIKTVFVEADIQGELSHLNCVDYVLNSPSIINCGATEEMVRDMLKRVGFSEGKASGSGGDCDDMISSLSGGWRMKLALARAMLQRADIILMDEPTNHLDVKNVKWVKNYINSLKDTTVIMVSHDSGLLDDCCDYILQIDKLKLKLHRGNLTEFVKNNPEAKSYFEFKASKFSFSFPKPCYLDGVKSRGKVLLKMDNVTFTYPGNMAPTINNITIKSSMSSRVACVGVNGAGKSTMIKVLTGQLEPTTGTVWKYPNTRIGYIAQHAFHHIESHLDKTPNEYIRWRYAHGNDREGLDSATMKITPEEEEELSKPITYIYKDESGKTKTENRVISKCTGQRRECEGRKKVYEYEVSWKDKPVESNTWFKDTDLIKYNQLYGKIIRMINVKIETRDNIVVQPLTEQNVEKHLNEIGLEPEYATHFRINALSGGQKVKVVLAAAMWDQPHILILDEPTNYLDRDSLGALADAITTFEGGIIMITHNDAFCRQLCPERWVLENGCLNTEGDVEWMNNAANQEIEYQQLDEMVDATGNEIKIKRKKKLNAKEKKKLMNLIKKKISNAEELDSEEEEYAIEWNL
jgi:elongation factor 3